MWGPIFRFFQTKQPGSIWRSPRWIPEGIPPRFFTNLASMSPRAFLSLSHESWVMMLKVCREKMSCICMYIDVYSTYTYIYIYIYLYIYTLQVPRKHSILVESTFWYDIPADSWFHCLLGFARCLFIDHRRAISALPIWQASYYSQRIKTIGVSPCQCGTTERGREAL